MGAFGELIDGCEMDVARHGLRDHRRPGRLLPPGGRLGRPAVARRLRRRRRTVGRGPLADDLGVALQLTNILRDVVEDRGTGAASTCRPPTRPTVGCPADLCGPPEPVAALVAFECARAQEWFDRGLQLLPLLDRRSRACVAAMAGIYRRLLVRIERDPIAVTAAPRSRCRRREKALGRRRAAWPG